ncbi:MAG TPA: LysR family transcriptional regulator [Eoetvoesiella sp.]
MNLNIRQVEAFVCVARLRGFSRAASQLHMSQAGLSILIKNLEARLGVQLVERTTRNITLTPIGFRVLPIAERMLGDTKTLLSLVKGNYSNYEGNVALALAPALATTVLPEALKIFNDRYPKVTVVFRECVNEELVGQLYANEVEFGLAFGVKSNKELECQRIGNDEFVVVCTPDHPLAAKRQVNWRDLVNYPFITTPLGSAGRATVDKAFELINERPTPIYSPTNSLTAVALARQQLGVAVVSSCIRPAALISHMVVKTLHEPVMRRDLSVVRRTGSNPSEPCQVLIKIFAELMGRA